MKRKLLVCLMITTIGTSIITGCGKENKSDTSDAKSTKTESMKEDAAEEESTDDAKTQDMTDYSDIEWPDNTATKMIPKPNVKPLMGKITFETEESLGIDIANVSEEYYYKYLEKCKKMGYTEDYSMTDLDTGKVYSADNSENGYGIVLMMDDNHVMTIDVMKSDATIGEAVGVDDTSDNTTTD